jgi:hypothetical protein
MKQPISLSLAGKLTDAALLVAALGFAIQKIEALGLDAQATLTTLLAYPFQMYSVRFCLRGENPLTNESPEWPLA